MTIEIGARVSVEARAMYPKTESDLEGTVIGELFSGLLLINLGPKFNGHNGHGYDLARGASDGSRNLWYVDPDYVTTLPDTIAPTKPSHAKEQTDRILNHLLAGNSISQLEAFGVYGIFRLAARIYDLKAKGHKIKTTMKKDANGKPYAEYALVSRNLRAA